MVSGSLHNSSLSTSRFLAMILKLVFSAFHNPDQGIMRMWDDSFLIEDILIACQEAVFSIVKMLIN